MPYPLIAAALLLAGCATTMRETLPDGSVRETRVGFGNRVSMDRCSIEPAQSVVDAGERVVGCVAQRASDAVVMRVVDAATTATR